MEVREAIERRSSIRSYSDEEVLGDVIETLERAS
jgi:nitroreductase